MEGAGGRGEGSGRLGVPADREFTARARSVEESSESPGAAANGESVISDKKRRVVGQEVPRRSYCEE